MNSFCCTYACSSKCRKQVVKLLEDVREHLYQANRTWLTSIRKHLTKSLVNRLAEASSSSKPKFFISHPVPECSCLRHDSSEPSTTTASTRNSTPTTSQLLSSLGIVHRCPVWMDNDMASHSKDKDNEDDFDEDDSTLSGLFFDQDGGSHEGGAGELNNKEEAQLDDQEELEGGER